MSFDSKNYLKQFVGRCTDSDRELLLQFADLSPVSLFLRRKLSAMTKSEALPSRRSHSLFCELGMINRTIFRESQPPPDHLTLICASVYLWLCSSRFGPADDTEAAVSVLVGLRACRRTPEYQFPFKNLLSDVAGPHNPNPETSCFALLGFSCCMHSEGKLTEVVAAEIEDRLLVQWSSSQDSLSDQLGLDASVVTEWVNLLNKICEDIPPTEASTGLFETFLPEWRPA